MSPIASQRRVDRLISTALGGWSVLVYVFLFLPIVVIVIYSFNKGRSLLIWDGLGTDWYRTLPDNHQIRDSLETSLKVAVGSSVIAVVLGSLAGIALARRSGKWVPFFMALVFLILVTPEIVDAISLLIWFVRIGGPFSTDFNVFGVVSINRGLLRLCVGHAIFSSAVVTLIVRARLAGLEESLEEAAADLYATPAQAFRKVTLPLIMPAVLAGALLSFSISLDNTIISTFVSVAGATPLPVYIFSALRTILRPEIAAVSTIMLGLTLVALMMVALVLRRGGDSTEDVVSTIAGVG